VILMPPVAFKRDDLPFLLGGASEIAVDTANLTPNKPLSETDASVFNVAFNAAGAQKMTLGQGDTVKVSLSTSASASLTPVFATSTGAPAKLLTTYGVGDFFKGGANADKVVLAFEAGAKVDAGAAGSFSYSVLKAGVELDAGVDAGYTYVRAADKSLALPLLLVDYFKTMRLPEQAEAGQMRTLEPGEAISLRYGGYLKVGAEVAAGYDLSGSKSFTLGGLALSEKYDLSIVGQIGLNAEVAGRFSILVTAAGELPGWTRVQVRRHRAKELTVAADVNVDVKNEIKLPATADEFLGAVLGVNGKNFINVFQKARELSDFDAFKSATDGLARRFVSELIGKGFDALSSRTEFDQFLARVNKVVTSYEQVEDRAVTLFDRYFDRLETLTGFLDRLAVLEDSALDSLRKQLTPELWNMLAQLTDGDPLGFLLRQVTVGGVKLDSAKELKKRALAALELIRSDAHKEIRDTIALAKTSFGIDVLFREAAKIDTVEELQALANEKVGEFVSRLVGRSLDSDANLKAAFAETRAVLDKIDGFKEKLFKSFKDAANSSYKTALHAQYSRASERDALVDVLIRPGHPRGAELLRQAGQANFEEILTTPDTDLVRLREGLFTHRTKRDRSFKVNIMGWHVNSSYSGFARVITEAEQRLVPSANGITVFTTLELAVERERLRKKEEIHVNFLLRALGESANVVKTDSRNTSFLIDALTSMTASYTLGFTDDETSPEELGDYLAFAKDLGLGAQGATSEALAPVLPQKANGSFGRVKASYDVRFGKDAVNALLSVKQISPAAELAIRTAMREIVLSNYLKSAEMHDVAFAYATPGVFDVFRNEGFATFTNTAAREFNVSLGSVSIAAPSKVSLDRMERHALVTLYNIEESMVAAIKGLYAILGSGQKMDPEVFEKRLADFGDALSKFDKFDQTTNKRGIGVNTAFVIFDALVRLAAKGEPANIAVLRLESDAGNRAVEKLFMSDAAAAG
jgi:hypothetical protein